MVFPDVEDCKKLLLVNHFFVNFMVWLETHILLKYYPGPLHQETHLNPEHFQSTLGNLMSFKVLWVITCLWKYIKILGSFELSLDVFERCIFPWVSLGIW